MIIQAGIKKAVFAGQYAGRLAVKLFKEAELNFSGKRIVKA